VFKKKAGISIGFLHQILEPKAWGEDTNVLKEEGGAREPRGISGVTLLVRRIVVVQEGKALQKKGGKEEEKKGKKAVRNQRRLTSLKRKSNSSSKNHRLEGKKNIGVQGSLPWLKFRRRLRLTVQREGGEYTSKGGEQQGGDENLKVLLREDRCGKSWGEKG